MIPTSEAIQEEAAENVTRIGGMFKRNSAINDDDDAPLRKTTTDYIYESNGGISRPANQPRIFSGQSQPTTALQKHQ